MKTVIFSVTFGIIGFGCGYFASNKINKKKYIKKADLEVESVKKSLTEYYEEKISELASVNKETESNEDATAKKTTKKAGKNNKEKQTKPKQEKNNLIDSDSIDYDKLKEARDPEKYIHNVRKYDGKEGTLDTEVIEEVKYKEPYVITPDEYADGDYDTQTLYYFADGVVADDNFNVLKDVKGYIGDKALKQFGLYEEDVVYVRNDKYKIDYEILLDEREYSKAAGKGVTTTYPSDEE